jgi:hypothetical protein
MRLSDYIAAIPNLHSWDEGATWNTGGFEARHFEPLHRLIAELLRPAPAFIETGAGNSTIFFLLHGPSKVVSIAPDEPVFGRIRDYCGRHGIPTEPLQALIEPSEWALPPIARQGAAFDFALIDGDHSLERTVLDFFYLNHTLGSGGLLMIDDVNVHSAKEVVRSIRDEPDFEQVLDLGKALVFRKTTDRPTLRAWCDQSYIKAEMAFFERLPDPFRIDRPTAAELAEAQAPEHAARAPGRYRSRISRAVRRLLP